MSVNTNLKDTIAAKLQELGAYCDNELPNFILMLIEKNKTLEEIREDLYIILDSATDEFVEWLGKHLQDIKNQNNGENHLSCSSNAPITLDTDLTDDQLDFEEENIDEEIEEDHQTVILNEHFSETATYSEPDEGDKMVDSIENGENQLEMNENSKRPFSSVENDNNHAESKPKVIKLNSGQHLNDIGLMRRQAALNQNNAPQEAERNRLQNRLTDNRFNDNTNESEDDITDLREKLNRMRHQHRQQSETPKSENSNQISTANKDESNCAEDKKDKCRFWPMCKNGSNCVFYHPTQQCSAFPNCKLGEKCNYIHPLCKFDAACTKKDCPYMHITKRFTPHLPSHTTMCKFFPNCNNPLCPFIHPKACMFGPNCKNTNCSFAHYDSKTVAKPHQLKWSSKKENGDTAEIIDTNPVATEPTQSEQELVVIIKDSNE